MRIGKVSTHEVKFPDNSVQTAASQLEAGDTNWNQVTLALSMDNLSDAKGNTVTAHGSAVVSTTIKKFGSGSMQFNGTTDYLELPGGAGFDFGTGDFTIEAWVYVGANSDPDGNGRRIALIFGLSPGTGSRTLEFNIDGNTAATGTGIDFWDGVLQDYITLPAEINQETWNHVACSKSNGVIYLCLNGVVAATPHTGSVGAPTGVARIGGDAGEPGYPFYLNGFIDDLRVTKGVGRYTANFVPPTRANPIFDFALIAHPAGYYSYVAPTPGNPNPEPSWSSVTSLLNFNDGTLLDGKTNQLWVPYGGCSTTTTTKYGANALFIATGQSISTTTSVMANAGTGNWTFEFWYLAYSWSSLSADHTDLAFDLPPIQCGIDSSTGNWNFEIYGGGWSWQSGTPFASDGQWHHVAVVSDSGLWMMYYDGFLVASKSESTDVSQTVGTVIGGRGANGDPNNQNYGQNIYIDDFRVTVGVARYTANFTPPGELPFLPILAQPGTNKGAVQFNSNSLLGGNSSLVWDDANSRLGIGTSSPTQSLHVRGGNLRIEGDGVTNTFGVMFPDNTTQITSAVVQGDQAYTLGSADGFAPYVGLLLHMEGANNANVFTDNSFLPKTVTTGGQTSTDQFKFGTSSGYFDSSWIQVDDPQLDFNFGVGDFTVEFWMYLLDDWSIQPDLAGVIGKKVDDSSSGWQVFAWNGHAGLAVRIGDFVTNGGELTDLIGNTAPSSGVWQHWAIVRSGTTVTIYLDGVPDGSYTNTMDINPGGTLFLGYSQTWNSYLSGVYLDEVRITKGIARYTSNFSASLQSAPWPNCPTIVHSGSIQYNAEQHFTGDTSFVWDPTNKRLGVGTTVPLEKIHVTGGNIKLEGAPGTSGIIFSDNTVQYGAAVPLRTNVVNFGIGPGTSNNDMTTNWSRNDTTVVIGDKVHVCLRFQPFTLGDLGTGNLVLSSGAPASMQCFVPGVLEDTTGGNKYLIMWNPFTHEILYYNGTSLVPVTPTSPFTIDANTYLNINGTFSVGQ